MRQRPADHSMIPTGAGPEAGLTRRRLLGATLAGAAAAGATSAAQAENSPPQPSARFAVIADSQLDGAAPEETKTVARVLEHIESRDPDFVLHCGDITEFGGADGVEHYLSAVPPGLASRIHYVPGNHETQWNADAWEEYHRHFGPGRHSFDAAGLHMIGLDPLVSQQWPSYQFSEESLEFLRADLKNVPDDVPIIMFNHFPLSDDHQFVNNAQKLLEIIEPYRVRAMFAGHIHKLQVRKFNGLTHVVGDALMQAPVYYWAERITDADEDRLALTEVHVPASGEATESLVTEAPLGESGPGDDFGPLDVDLSGDREEVTVRARSEGRGSAQWPSQLAARIYPQGVAPLPWTPLERRGQGPRWDGHLDVAALPPGEHRVQLRASDGGEDPVWNAVAPVTVPSSSSAQVAWNHPLSMSTVMAGLARRGTLVIAAATDGTVEALTVGTGGAQSAWQRELGGVYKAPVMAPDEKTVLIGSADHQLYALEAETGRTVWSYDLGAPVQCEIAVLDLPDGPRIGVAAGTTFFLLSLDGSPVWQADIGGTFTGQACTDGKLVFTGSSDGQVHALEADTGEQAWTTMVAGRTDTPYHRTIYGPWAAPLQMLPTGDLFVPAHTGATTLSADSGEVRWSVDGLHRVQFTRPVISEFGVLVIDGKNGAVLLLEEATGETLWQDGPETLPFVPGSSASWGSSPVPTADPAIYWMVSTAGLLVRIDLAQPEITTVLKVSNTYTMSTPALLADEGLDLLVTIDNTGVVRGVTGLGEVAG